MLSPSSSIVSADKPQRGDADVAWHDDELRSCRRPSLVDQVPEVRHRGGRTRQWIGCPRLHERVEQVLSDEATGSGHEIHGASWGWDRRRYPRWHPCGNTFRWKKRSLAAPMAVRNAANARRRSNSISIVRCCVSMAFPRSGSAFSKRLRGLFRRSAERGDGRAHVHLHPQLEAEPDGAALGGGCRGALWHRRDPCVLGRHGSDRVQSAGREPPWRRLGSPSRSLEARTRATW